MKKGELGRRPRRFQGGGRTRFESTAGTVYDVFGSLGRPLGAFTGKKHQGLI